MVGQAMKWGTGHGQAGDVVYVVYAVYVVYVVGLGMWSGWGREAGEGLLVNPLCDCVGVLHVIA